MAELFAKLSMGLLYPPISHALLHLLCHRSLIVDVGGKLFVAGPHILPRRRDVDNNGLCSGWEMRRVCRRTGPLARYSTAKTQIPSPVSIRVMLDGCMSPSAFAWPSSTQTHPHPSSTQYHPPLSIQEQELALPRLGRPFTVPSMLGLGLLRRSLGVSETLVLGE